MWYVYEIYDSYGSVVYVGESKDPKSRMYTHTKRKPDAGGRGRFYGQDVTYTIVDSFEDRRMARELEGQLKLQYGMEWTEKLRDFQPGNKLGGRR